jgi:hypothetical protein
VREMEGEAESTTFSLPEIMNFEGSPQAAR